VLKHTRIFLYKTTISWQDLQKKVPDLNFHVTKKYVEKITWLQPLGAMVALAPRKSCKQWHSRKSMLEQKKVYMEKQNRSSLTSSFKIK